MKAIIIGSGISGLTAALYMLRDGHDVTVLEQYGEVGGVTAAIRKDGYTWELGQLILEGFAPGEQAGYILEDLGIADKIRTVKNDRIYSFPDFVIRRPDAYAGPWWRKEFFKKLFPEDADGIDEYYRLYVRFMELVTLARRSERETGIRSLVLKARLYLKLLPLLPRIGWSARKLGSRLFSSGKMQAALMSILADFVVRPSQFPGLGIPAVNPEPAFDSRVPLEVSGSGRQPSYRNVIGGVNALVGVMAGEIAKAGGVVRTGTAAVKILIEDGKVKGVKTGDGSVLPADVVISSGGAKEVFHELVGPGNLPPKFLKMVDELPLMESIFMVHLGVDFDPVPFQKGALCYYYLTYDIEGGIEHVQSGRYHEGKDGFLVYVPSAHSPGMAPPGRHAVTVYTIAPSELGEGTWEARKEEFADKLLAEAEKYVPGLREHTLVRVILTPDDFKKRTHCKHHSFGGFAPVMGKKGIPFRTPVKGLWFVGSQSESGAGLNSVLEGTWRCIRLIRKDLGA